MEEGKTLVACPVWHGDRVNMQAFRKQYEGHDILLVDNTLDRGQFTEELKGMGYDNIIRHEWNPEETYLMNMLGDCDEKIRQYVVDHGEYSHWFWTAPDIRTPEHAIEKLKAHGKDIVGYPCNMYGPEGPPAVFVNGEMNWVTPKPPADSLNWAGRFSLNIYTWEQLNARHGLFEVHGIGGATLYHRKVLETCKFRHPEEMLWGEDLWWYTECGEKGFKTWCDSSERAYNHTGVDPHAMFECRLNLFRFLTRWVRKHPDSFYNKFLE